MTRDTFGPMRLAMTPPYWRVRLRDGTELVLWADAFGENDDHHVFLLVVEATDDEVKELHVERFAPNRPDTFWAVVATIPSAEVVEVATLRP
jgi:hypothetical protein